MRDYWVDGHFIMADDIQEALAIVLREYDHAAENARPWTEEDQAEYEEQWGDEFDESDEDWN